MQPARGKQGSLRSKLPPPPPPTGVETGGQASFSVGGGWPFTACTEPNICELHASTTCVAPTSGAEELYKREK